MKKNTIKLIICFFLCIFTIGSFFMPVQKQFTQKNYRYLLMLSSFKRPIFLSGQIYRLLNQTYRNFDISVSIKGSPNDYGFASTFSREFDRFKQSGKVFVRFDHNGHQFSNLLDTVRHLDINNYDYFCKIDDDDWYAPDYLEELNRNLNQLSKKEQAISSSTYHLGLILTEDIKQTYLNKNTTPLSGPTQCFSKAIIQIALRLEKNPKLITKYLPNANESLFVNREDRFLDHMARQNGTHIERDALYPSVIYGWQYRSVIRNYNYVDFK
ncbi:MAG: hypothetical protein J6V53_06615 [Alphaproteobacteria bacterium]|nr:hypothetical protein [Alphaproteobacteria bacterium]